MAAAVILRRPIKGLADSKALTPERRELLSASIRERALVGIGAASVAEIERLNILRATHLAMRRAVARLPLRPRLALVDGNADPGLGLPTRCVVGGDALVPAISAASIVAKVLRDRLMRRLAARHPGYGWDRNAGYPTAEHRRALASLGLTPHHRRGFGPCKGLEAPSRPTGGTPVP